MASCERSDLFLREAAGTCSDEISADSLTLFPSSLLHLFCFGGPNSSVSGLLDFFLLLLVCVVLRSSLVSCLIIGENFPFESVSESLNGWRNSNEFGLAAAPDRWGDCVDFASAETIGDASLPTDGRRTSDDFCRARKCRG